MMTTIQKTMVKIAIAGKGGVGKTLIASGLSQAFACSGQRTLAIDADPSPNLGLMLGLSAAETEAITPVSRNEELIRAKTGTPFPGVYNLSFSVEDIIRNYSMPTPAGVHLLVLGTVRQMGAGCSCPANTVLRNILNHLVTGTEDAVVLDMEAGVEHLGRGTAENVDLLIVVTTADSRALSTAGSIARISKDAGIPHVVLAGNRIRNAGEDEIILTFGREHDIQVLGSVPFDPRVSQGGIAGESVLQLAGSPALCRIDEMAGEILSSTGRKRTKERGPDLS
ncbi:MAG TPA: AAA family ATPase [Methanoregulaceae archaeon]|nr:AAA family ATPase [Methanoregulaceae archaeon]